MIRRGGRDQPVDTNNVYPQQYHNDPSVSARRGLGVRRPASQGLSLINLLVVGTVAIAGVLFFASLVMYHKTETNRQIRQRFNFKSNSEIGISKTKSLKEFAPETSKTSSNQKTPNHPISHQILEEPLMGGMLPQTPTNHRTTEEATNAMMKQPSSWVDGEQKLRKELSKLQQQQLQVKENLDLTVSTRWLGENTPHYPTSSNDEEAWKKIVDPILKEISDRAKQEDQKRKDLLASTPRKVYQPRNPPHIPTLQLPNANHDSSPNSATEGSSHSAAIGDSHFQPPRRLTSTQHKEYPLPYDAAPSTDHKTVRLRPTLGKHRPDANAIFAFAEGYDLHTYVGFLESLKREAPSFDGDIVLSVSSLSKLKTGVEEYLRSQSNLVLYTVDWTCYEPNTMAYAPVGPKEGQNLCKIDGLYGTLSSAMAEQLGAESAPLPDPRDPRPVATARYELYWSWASQYSPASWIMLIDSRDTHFQQNPFDGLPNTDSGSLYLFEENAEEVRIGKSNFNRRWLEQAYTPTRVSPFLDEPVICSGSTMGQQRAIEAYLRAMVAQFDETKCKLKGCDQGFHNFLLYSGTLQLVKGITDILIFSQGTGIINNLGLLRDKPLRDRGVLSPQDLILNWDQTISRVAHQVDRDAEFNRIIKKRKMDYQNLWSGEKGQRSAR